MNKSIFAASAIAAAAASIIIAPLDPDDTLDPDTTPTWAPTTIDPAPTWNPPVPCPDWMHGHCYHPSAFTADDPNHTPTPTTVPTPLPPPQSWTLDPGPPGG